LFQDILEAARQLSKAKRALSNSLATFQFDCIGTSLTDDEVIIANSLKQVTTARKKKKKAKNVALIMGT
jgi:hypothetical protein